MTLRGIQPVSPIGRQAARSFQPSPYVPVAQRGLSQQEVQHQQEEAT